MSEELTINNEDKKLMKKYKRIMKNYILFLETNGYEFTLYEYLRLNKLISAGIPKKGK